MYLGSRSPHTQTVINWTGKQLEAQEVTWTPAMYCAFREIFDNALDEVIGHSSGSRIDVSYDESSAKFSVKDDGRGIPIDWDENENMHKATMVLVYPRAGRNFGERGEVRGTNGIGSSATIHCCETSTVTVYRDGNKVKDLQVSEPKITKSSGKSGTELTFTLSKSVFKHRILPTSFVQARVYEVAANHPNIKFTFNGEKVTVKNTVEKTFFSDKSFIKIVSEADKFLSTFYLVPNFSAEGEYVHSTVNDIPAFNGGHHIDVFKLTYKKASGSTTLHKCMHPTLIAKTKQGSSMRMWRHIFVWLWMMKSYTNVFREITKNG